MASGIVVHTQLRGGVLWPRSLGLLRRQHEPDVGVLVGRFVAGRRHWHDRNMDDLTVRPGDEIVEPGLLPTLAKGDREWIVLAGIAVPADLEPGLLAGVPAQEHLLGRSMHDHRRCGDVQGGRPIPRFADGDAITDTTEIARLDQGSRLIVVEGGDEGIGRPSGDLRRVVRRMS